MLYKLINYTHLPIKIDNNVSIDAKSVKQIETDDVEKVEMLKRMGVINILPLDDNTASNTSAKSNVGLTREQIRKKLQQNREAMLAHQNSSSTESNNETIKKSRK